MRSRLLALLALLVTFTVIFAPAAQAKVVISFYSHELGASFPHGFIMLDGTLDESGKEIHETYGYTPVNISPAILMGNVKGGMDVAKPGYIKASTRQFAFPITDAQYRGVIATMIKWRDEPGRIYNMNTHNCVHFVMAIAEQLGLKVNRNSEFVKKPRSFLEEVKRLNPGLK